MLNETLIRGNSNVQVFMSFTVITFITEPLKVIRLVSYSFFLHVNLTPKIRTRNNTILKFTWSIVLRLLNPLQCREWGKEEGGGGMSPHN